MYSTPGLGSGLQPKIVITFKLYNQTSAVTVWIFTSLGSSGYFALYFVS